MSSSASAISVALERTWAGKTSPEQAVAIHEAAATIVAEERLSPSAALKRAKLLVGCYRARDFVDVETFVTALVANLCDYPECVVNLVTDPKHGLPATNTFCPAINEVIDACKKARDRILLASRAIDRMAPTKGDG
jgi:hypothetical protein